MKISIKYLVYFVLLFLTEFLIAVFVHDRIIRPYVGDILVVILIYCLLKIFLQKQIVLLPVYIFLFAVGVEISQYFHVIRLLHLQNNRLASVIIGTSFSFIDIICYLIGCLFLFLFELYYKSKRQTKEVEQC